MAEIEMDIEELAELATMLGELAPLVLQRNARGSFVTHQLADGRIVDLFPITFGRARLGISRDLQVQFYDTVY